jgi:NAD+ synthetase
MKVYNPLSNFSIHNEILELIIQYRKSKNFNPSQYIEVKSQLLNQYMINCNLKSVVVAVSGGIDSALVLSIVNYAKKLPGSPIEKIVAVSLPVSNSKGATGQLEATTRAKELCDNLNLNLSTIELKKTHEIIEKSVSDTLKIESSDWALGQLVAHSRTPTLYYIATLLTQNNLPSIIVGTTNKDEGMYLGYFGKASDGLVDVQLISDLHKSEVYECSKTLNVPKSILDVSPKGDMYDGRIDEEVFGAPYDFVEYYLHFLTLKNDIQEFIINSLSTTAKEQFLVYKNNRENLHNYNRHKYLSASPAVHLDIFSSFLKNGWKTNNTIYKPIDTPIIKEKFVGLFEIQQLPSFFINKPTVITKSFNVQNNNILKLENVLSSQECDWLLNQSKNQQWINANKYGQVNKSDTDTFSQRLSIYNELLSYVLYQRISPFLDSIKIFNQPFPIISNEKNIWCPVNLNPLLRFIKYKKGHSLVTHYDDTYSYNLFKKTLLTVIIYLNDSNAKTRFIYDKQHILNDSLKDFNDQNSLSDDNLVLLEFSAKKGDVLIFDHRVLHDATSPEDEKIIIRSDIVFESPYFGFDL